MSDRKQIWIIEFHHTKKKLFLTGAKNGMLILTPPKLLSFNRLREPFCWWPSSSKHFPLAWNETIISTQLISLLLGKSFHFFLSEYILHIYKSATQTPYLYRVLAVRDCVPSPWRVQTFQAAIFITSLLARTVVACWFLSGLADQKTGASDTHAAEALALFIFLLVLSLILVSPVTNIGTGSPGRAFGWWRRRG